MIGDLFSGAAKRATERNLSVMELIGTADQLSTAGATQLVRDLYRTWIEHNSDSPLLHAIYFNYGVVLSNANDLQGAKTALSEAIRVNPEFLPPYINLGLVLSRLGANGEAVGQWQQLVNKLQAVTNEAVTYKITAYKHIGRVLEEGRLDTNAEEVLRQSLDLDPGQRDVVEHWIMLRQKQCKWPVIQPWGIVTRQHLMKNISALSLASYTDDPLLQLANAYVYSKTVVGQPKLNFIETHESRPQDRQADRIKVGYLSSDIREHAIGFLTAEVFELHDRSKVEVFLYYCGIPSADSIHTRVKAVAEHWLDISGMTDEEAVGRMVADGIDILVDLNGNTLSARMKIMPMRPAPIIVNWLGFPGTTGSAYHNYIIADDFIIPPASEIYYSEKVVRLPCYQPNDRKRVISPTPTSRQEVGLPEDAMVYCCFNGTQKFTPHTWKRWMSILHQVPGSVLWLLESVEGVKNQLKELAKQHDVAPERLFFAPRKHVTDHLVRYPLADLFLDTSPYGAHTTSSDALWMGVPVLTLPGRSFASRVCGSLVKSAGMGELVCDTAEEYVALAVELGKNKAKLLDLRRRLNAGRDSCVLFDTPALVSHLETLYAGMWRDFKSGTLPRPDLSNLDTYNDIGIELDKDDVELLTVGNYLNMYKQKLAEKGRLCFMRDDGRLWTEGATKFPSKEPAAQRSPGKAKKTK